MSKAYSIHIDDDVAPILDRYKKVAGRPDTRGKYVSRAIRSYEGLLGTEKQLMEQIANAESEANLMRTMARTFAIRMHKAIDRHCVAIGAIEASEVRDDAELWNTAQNAIQDELADAGLLDVQEGPSDHGGAQ
jgi:RIO-like serine/threonine protein kinase